jgi:hypothetical protein
MAVVHNRRWFDSISPTESAAAERQIAVLVVQEHRFVEKASIVQELAAK